MPVHKVDGGYRWGSIPKKPTTKKHAQEIAAAAHSNGYHEDLMRDRRKKS